MGIPIEVQGLEATMTLAAEDIGPLEVPLDQAGPGHYSTYGYEVPFSGDWEMGIEVRISDFEQSDAEVTVPIG